MLRACGANCHAREFASRPSARDIREDGRPWVPGHQLERELVCRLLLFIVSLGHWVDLLEVHDESIRSQMLERNVTEV